MPDLHDRLMDEVAVARERAAEECVNAKDPLDRIAAQREYDRLRRMWEPMDLLPDARVRQALRWAAAEEGEGA